MIWIFYISGVNIFKSRPRVILTPLYFDFSFYYMGIKGLSVLFKKVGYTPSTGRIEDFSGKTIGIDVSIYLYNYTYNLRRQKEPILSGFFNLVLYLLKHKITPIFVFDGMPSAKKYVIAERKDAHEKKNEKIKQTKHDLQVAQTNKGIQTNQEVQEDRAQIKDLKRALDNLQKSNISINYNEVKELKNLFDLMCVKYICAEGEADQCLDTLWKQKTIDAVMSSDTDMIARGIGVVLSGLNYFNGNTFKVFYIQEILSKFGLAQDQFQDMCILCGCDYCKYKIAGVGTIGAYSMIKTYGTLTKCLETKNVAEQVKQEFLDAKQLFGTQSTTTNTTTNNINNLTEHNLTEHKIFNKYKLIAFLEEHKLLTEKTRKTLKEKLELLQPKVLQQTSNLPSILKQRKILFIRKLEQK